MRLLVIEDEKDLAENLRKGLLEQGYAVDIALDGEEGGFMAETEPYDLIILDLMLPKIDGLTICKTLREKGINTPILMLTAKSRLDDKIEGFNTGADDYLTKPFSVAELYVRIKALLRRKDQIELPVLEINDLKINSAKHEVYRGKDKITLTPKEFSILELMAKNKDEVVTRTMILDHVWDTSYTGNSNVVDVLIGSLRKKIDKPGLKKLIQTVYGVGFKLAEEE
jgi:DNA-binding response OmpR family regulator